MTMYQFQKIFCHFLIKSIIFMLKNYKSLLKHGQHCMKSNPLPKSQREDTKIISIDGYKKTIQN